MRCELRLKPVAQLGRIEYETVEDAGRLVTAHEQREPNATARSHGDRSEERPSDPRSVKLAVEALGARIARFRELLKDRRGATRQPPEEPR